MKKPIPLAEAHHLLRQLDADLDGWRKRLNPLAEGIEGAAWEAETDAPCNAAAGAQSSVDSILRERRRTPAPAAIQNGNGQGW